MRLSTATFIAVPLVWATLVVSPWAAQSRSVVDGVFTDDQATRGEGEYKKDCSSCHGGDLAGDGFAPALSGSEFLSNWNGTTMGDLFDRVRISMPPGGPGSVSAQSKADIIAFVLKANRFPGGSAELASSADALRDIKFELPK